VEVRIDDMDGRVHAEGATASSKTTPSLARRSIVGEVGRE